MEILAQSKYKEYEEFAEQHPQGCFTKSVFWPEVKNNWDHAVVVSRDSEGKIRGGMLVLMPTAMPSEPLIKRLGTRTGSTSGSFSVSS